MDEINYLYFIVGFLLGVLLVGSIAVALGLIYYEWIKDQDKWLFVFAVTYENQILKHNNNW